MAKQYLLRRNKREAGDGVVQGFGEGITGIGIEYRVAEIEAGLSDKW